MKLSRIENTFPLTVIHSGLQCIKLCKRYLRVLNAVIDNALSGPVAVDTLLRQCKYGLLIRGALYFIHFRHICWIHYSLFAMHSFIFYLRQRKTRADSFAGVLYKPCLYYIEIITLCLRKHTRKHARMMHNITENLVSC